jgi:hypothetical protein
MMHHVGDRRNYQPSAIGYLLLAISYRLTGDGYHGFDDRYTTAIESET